MLFDGQRHRGRAAEWYVRPKHREADGLARRLPGSRLVAQVLANRGLLDSTIATPFLNPKLSDLLDPADLPGCVGAARLIVDAIRDNRRIVVYGDYDVDGLSGLAILYHALAVAGAKPSYYIPSRIDEGYGLNAQAMHYLVADPAGPRAELIITVDCGITAVEPVAVARQLGAAVVVTDHHSFDHNTQAGLGLPACPLVHPRLPGSTYANADLCGAGVAFKLAWQIGRTLANSPKVSDAFREFLQVATSLAALGTIADIVPLAGENRVLARHGLRALPTVRHIGLSAFIDSCSLKSEKLSSYDIGFILGPRLNAAGRMGHAKLAAELLTTTCRQRAATISAELAQQNRARQELERKTVDEARSLAEQLGMTTPDRRAIVLGCQGWHPGVIGLVASRLAQEFCRPTAIIAFGNGEAPHLGHGSCRSVPGFDVGAALSACREHLVSFGGHPMAAGLRIEAGQLEAFTEAFVHHANTRIRREDLCRRYDAEAEVSLRDLTPASVDDLARLEPFGQGNPKPLFTTALLPLASEPKVIGQRGTTLAFDLHQDGVVRRAVCFDGASWHHDLCAARHARLLFEPQVNRFNGSAMAEMVVKDVAFA